jgi:hypothetical protein
VFGGAVCIGEDILWVFWNKSKIDTRISPLEEQNGYKYAHSQGLFEVISNEVDW